MNLDKTVPKMHTSPKVCAYTTLGNSLYQCQLSVELLYNKKRMIPFRDALFFVEAMRFLL